LACSPYILGVSISHTPHAKLINQPIRHTSHATAAAARYSYWLPPPPPDALLLATAARYSYWLPPPDTPTNYHFADYPSSSFQILNSKPDFPS